MSTKKQTDRKDTETSAKPMGFWQNPKPKQTITDREIKTFCGDTAMVGDRVCYLKTLKEARHNASRFRCVGEILAITKEYLILSVEDIDCNIPSKRDYVGQTLKVSKFSDIICKMRDEETDG